MCRRYERREFVLMFGGKRRMRKLSFLAVILHAAALWTAGAYAADWPAKPVRVVSPFAAGGAADVIARLFSDALGKAFNQQFVVENRTGAGGLIGAQSRRPRGARRLHAAWRPACRRTCWRPRPARIPAMIRSSDFTHIAYFGGAPSVILVHPSLGVKTFKELVSTCAQAATASNTCRPGPARSATS